MSSLEVMAHVDPEAWNAEVMKLRGCSFHTYEWGLFSAESNSAEPLYLRWTGIGPESRAIGLGLLKKKKIVGIPFWASLSIGSLPACAGSNGFGEEITALILYCRDRGVGSLDVHSFGTPVGTEVLKELGFQVQRRWEFLVPMEGVEEDLWKRIHSKKRNLIRKGQKENLRVERTSDLQGVLRFRALALETHERKTSQRIPFPKPPNEIYYRLLKERLIDTGLGRLYLAYDGLEPVGGAFFVAYNGVAYYMLSSAGEHGLRKGAPDVILWTSMTDYQREGYNVFNLGGLSQSELEGRPLEESGLYHFKKRFASEAYPCYKGTLIMRPSRQKIYDFLRKVKTKLGHS